MVTVQGSMFRGLPASGGAEGDQGSGPRIQRFWVQRFKTLDPWLLQENA
jgi:hypothetical protein